MSCTDVRVVSEDTRLEVICSAWALALSRSRAVWLWRKNATTRWLLATRPLAHAWVRMDATTCVKPCIAHLHHAPQHSGTDGGGVRQSQWGGFCKDVGAWPSSFAKRAGATTSNLVSRAGVRTAGRGLLVALRACEPRACRLHRRRVAGHERSHLLGADQVDPGLEAL